MYKLRDIYEDLSTVNAGISDYAHLLANENDPVKRESTGAALDVLVSKNEELLERFWQQITE